MKLNEMMGALLFCIGASTLDSNQLIGAVMVLTGMGVLVYQAKKEGMWR